MVDTSDTNHGSRHGAVLVSGGSVLNTGHNSACYSAFGNRFRHEGKGPATRHAEISCILGIDKSVTAGASLYVVRIDLDGAYRISRPCCMCMDVMHFVGIRKVYYTTGTDRLGYIRL